VHVGLDLLTLRWTRTGMHAYVRNLYRELRRLVGPHRLTPFLFGHPDAGEPEHVQSIGPEALAQIRYVWDRGSPRLLCDRFRRPPWLVRLLDRKLLLRCWRVTAARRGIGTLPPLPDAPDLFHHVAFHVYPLHRVNVVTVPDLGALGEPGAHSDELKRLLEEGLPLANRADLVLTYSEHTRRDVAARLNVPLDRIRVTPLAAHEQFRPAEDASALRGVLARHGLADRPYVLAVGMLEARKNLVRLLEAFAMLKRAEPGLGHRLVLAGVKAWGAEAVFAAVRRLGLGGEVRWLDFVPFEDLPALLGGADLLAHPSLYEGFGLPPLEAMACGTPVVASATTSLPEVVGEAGVLADPLRPESFAAAMRRVLTDRTLHAELRWRGVQQARRFSWERTARLTLAAYEEAERLSRERPVPPPAGPQRADRARAFWRPWVIDRLARRALSRIGGR
jgi:glycosyltransferase involved in cell wall biosynthesis